MARKPSTLSARDELPLWSLVAREIQFGCFEYSETQFDLTSTQKAKIGVLECY